MRSVMKAALFAALIAAGQPAAAEIGLAARFGDVVIEGVAPGRSYNLRETSRLPFAVENRGSSETEVLVEVLPPPASELSPGYEAIPDPSWVRPLPERMTVGAKQLGYFDLVLTVPDEERYKGRHFQALLRARTAGTGMMALAIENKLRFSVGPGPETLQAEKKKKAMQRLDFDVSPRTLYLTEVPAGGLFDAQKRQKKSVRVANYAQEPLALKLSSEPWDRRSELPEGYEPIPDPAWVTPKPARLKVPHEAIRQATFEVRIPDKPEYRGKKYAALIRTGLETGFWLDAPVKVFIETQK